VRRALFLASVERDLRAIFVYIAEASDSVAVGREFVRQIRDHCHKLASLPGTLGRERPELLPGIRSIAYRNYVIFFRYSDGRLEVVDILEGHRDIAAFFDSKSDR
jgi:plasmid stabilization system protein ParE